MKLSSRTLIVIFICFSPISCSAPGTHDRTIYQDETQRACTEKPPNYTSAFEGRLRADLPLEGKSAAEAEGLIKSYLSREPVGTKRGGDLQGYLFYICQMANNGRWSEETTKSLINLFMDKWPVEKQEATQPHPKCKQQLESGYALKEEIDNEYWYAKNAGTFQDRRDEFAGKWDRDAGRWAAETETILVQIGGPIERGRFRNAPISATALNNTNAKWNGIRNYLQSRLSALDLICSRLR
ncbi:MAG: hypothetical protein Q8L74_11805 [Nitrospirota bacterium]|nr:hypothetical protein [Nitrospirota bacterium]